MEIGYEITGFKKKKTVLYSGFPINSIYILIYSRDTMNYIPEKIFFPLPYRFCGLFILYELMQLSDMSKFCY